MTTETIIVTTVEELSSFSLGADTLLCPSENLLLNVEMDDASYTWQDGSNDAQFFVETPGTYALTISNACGEASSAIQVDYVQELSLELGRDTFFCPGDAILLDATHPAAVSYLWQDGSTQPTLAVSSAETYAVTISSPCESLQDALLVQECESCNIYVPNVFSPNDDGFNDYFQAYSDCAFDNYQLQIFDRWGNLIFETNDPQEAWNGKFGGNSLNNGLFVWVLRLQVVENNRPRQIEQSGDVLLLRSN